MTGVQTVPLIAIDLMAMHFLTLLEYVLNLKVMSDGIESTSIEIAIAD
jgi:hypothetical protein